MKIKKTQLGPFGLMIEPLETETRIDDLQIAQLKKDIEEHYLLVLRNFGHFKSSNEFSHYCENWGEVAKWPFGTVLELKRQEAPKDHIFDNSYMPMHWDGMFRKNVPQYQIFHCSIAPDKNSGGETTFSNTIKAYASATTEQKRLWEQATGVYKRKMEFYDSITRAPIVSAHPQNGKNVIRFNEPYQSQRGNFVNPSDISFEGVTSEQQDELIVSLRNALYDSKNYYSHQWQRGDIVVADNFALLHGRETFKKESPRFIQRTHIESSPPLKNSFLESYQ